MSRQAAEALQPTIDQLAQIRASLPAFDVEQPITPAMLLGVVAEMRLADLRLQQIYRQGDHLSAVKEVAYLEIIQALVARVDALELRIPPPEHPPGLAQA